MKLLLDQGLPVSAVQKLNAIGWHVQHTSELGMSRATDSEILTYARADDFVVVTLDADFHALLAIEHAHEPSVIRIRREGLDGTALAQLLREICPQIEAQLHAGAIVTVTEHALRLRHLPVLSSD